VGPRLQRRNRHLWLQWALLVESLSSLDILKAESGEGRVPHVSRGVQNVGIILAGSPERGMGVTTNFRSW
jgi:hypothetical protein